MNSSCGSIKRHAVADVTELQDRWSDQSKRASGLEQLQQGHSKEKLSGRFKLGRLEVTSNFQVFNMAMHRKMGGG